jgi:hypothetical protein
MELDSGNAHLPDWLKKRADSNTKMTFFIVNSFDL